MTWLATAQAGIANWLPDSSVASSPGTLVDPVAPSWARLRPPFPVAAAAAVFGARATRVRSLSRRSRSVDAAAAGEPVVEAQLAAAPA
ncbi:MAG: hypothetical protein ABW002_17105 [Xanthomonas sp.]